MTYILYPSQASGGEVFRQAHALMEQLGEDKAQLRSLDRFDPIEVLKYTTPDDEVILLGGDGTLNRLVNRDEFYPCKHPIHYLPGGTGNDFYRDVCEAQNEEKILLTPYLQKLPTVEFDGKTMRFLNGVGAGLDGWCCTVMEACRAAKKKLPSYTSVALRGLLYKFKPRTATVTVDGVTHWFSNVYIATTMFGKYYGGGVKIAPDQNRADTARVSAIVVHSKSRLAVLPIFGTIFSGGHVKYKKFVTVLCGNDIKVSFDSPCPMQVDGEVFEPVSTYRITAPDPIEEPATV